MGNILNLMLGATTLEHCHQKKCHQGRISDNLFEPLHILVFRAILNRARCKASYQKGIADSQFQLLSILICIAMSARRRQVYEEGTPDDQFKLYSILICGVISDYICQKLMHENRISNDPLEKLPEDVLCIILSTLPLDKAARTSTVSRKWRFLWTVRPKLSFDGITVHGKNTCMKHQYFRKFIDNVDAVLAQCHVSVVDELAIKVDFDTMLVIHLDNWVNFMVSSRTKFLTLDLAPEDFQGRDDRYLFPFKLLDSGSISRLQEIHLSFGHLQPPIGFSGFPNLRKLDLNLMNVSRKDLEEMLSNCCNLSIVRCHLEDELKVNGPLPHLLYLNISFCGITKIVLRGVQLTTFIYKGTPVCIDLGKSSRLENADICFSKATLEDATTQLVNVFTHVQNLIFDTFCKSTEMPYLVHTRCKFSQLRHLKLLLLFENEVDTLSLVSFMMSAPFIENFEITFNVDPLLYTEHVPTKTRRERPYKYLKNVCMKAFQGSRGQLEFLSHVVENAPSLEFLTLDSWRPLLEYVKDADRTRFVDSAHRTARRCLQGKISPKCSLRLL
ncbi:F-box/FBD/LRR-repeat protein At3g14710 isoform X2 [Brachypodium distachyon]|nr:F-box/FBD/LRR-repeat protein At3g14710 isoform X2 [Brachypodium distachyon]XP_024317464.1 F-box/FBD/LRR-repeat protein At3g14710 isoform X2 [Brachypodium distachyon]KQK01227.1 hypothetical protein BRADI_3g54590v3 [Brachypodium distachyon]KQK01230.1 hypothetical protein BRADI_3g54590v3 [Brachypodium distachyon]PNT69391.1 hypothetical protein BRADI_3g54590v3 [Brachypodium distachyon]|eukprot:XP_003572916.1 F-box/FBD/LRR-repeat protein At3g14710 isoform X2 [Brachypodium distachyon]